VTPVTRVTLKIDGDWVLRVLAERSAAENHWCYRRKSKFMDVTDVTRSQLRSIRLPDRDRVLRNVSSSLHRLPVVYVSGQWEERLLL